jgi:hypothetical protein
MPRQFAEQAVKFPNFSFRLPVKNIFKKILKWTVLAAVCIAAVYIARNFYLNGKKTAERQAIAAAAKQYELAEALRYPQCPNARDIVIGKNETTRVETKPNCWSGWIIIRSRYYYLETHGGKNLFIWRKNEYDSNSPPETLLDGTSEPYKPHEGYFKLRSDKGPLLVTVEGR